MGLPRLTLFRQGAREGGRTLRMDVFLPSKTLPSKNLVFTENPYRCLLRTLGVHPTTKTYCFSCFSVPHSTIEIIRKPDRQALVGDRKGTPKNLCDKDFAELSNELSGAIGLKTLVLFGSALELFRKLIWCCSCDLLSLCFLFGP